MSRGRVVVGWILCIAVCTGCTGCFTIAKQAFNEARGAQGEVLPIHTLREAALATYRGIEFQPATTTVGATICPPEVLRAYDRCANQSKAELRRVFPGDEPKLTVSSEVLYFQKKGLLGGAFMLTRVRLQAGGEAVGDMLVKAESEAFRAGGEDDLAGASVTALKRFLERYAGAASTGRAGGAGRSASTTRPGVATRPAGP